MIVMTTEEILKKLHQFFKAQKNVLFCYLFGSFATKRFNSLSDVDVAVFLDEKKCRDLFQERLLLMSELEGLLKMPVEVVVLNDTRSIFFKFVIIKEGRLISEKDHQAKINFELATMRDYYDFKPFLEQYNQAYVQRELSKI